MKKQTSQVEVTISQTEDGVKVSNNLGNEWQFPKAMMALDALVLLLSSTIRARFDQQSAFRDTFAIEITIK